jgi:ABC-type transport system involved in multi-copper enzyme maturation permease subunit
MTFLPILQRELRVRARNPAQYWGRLAVAAIGVLVSVPPLIWSGVFMRQGTIGRGAFHGLVSSAFMLCCAACLLTADSISRERREGTLGLLLLTRVKHLDILVGKFGSSGLASLLALVAALPVLMLPLLAGGVTGGEAARTWLALLNTLFLALSIGLWASARGVERFRTGRLAFLVLLTVLLTPSVLGWLFSLAKVSLATSLATIVQAADLNYKTAAGRYWFSLGLVHMFGWLFLITAMLSLRKQAGNFEAENEFAATTAPPVIAPPPTLTATGSTASLRCGYCGRENDAAAVFCRECGTALRQVELPPRKNFGLASAPTPLHWLLRRQRGSIPLLWVAAVIGFFHYAMFGAAELFRGIAAVGTIIYGVSWSLSLVTSALTGSIFAWVASRFFVEARRTGELELLLTTPLGAGQIIATQWDVLKRLVRWPLVAMLLPLFLQGLLFGSFVGVRSDPWRFYFLFSILLSAIHTILSVAASCWVAPWFAVRASGQGQAVLRTVLLVNGLPYLVSLGFSMLYRMLTLVLRGQGNLPLSLPWLLGWLAPQVAVLLFYFWLIRLSRRQLHLELAGAESLDLGGMLSSAQSRALAAIRRARDWRAV